MVQYINKSAVAAEIEKIQNEMLDRNGNLEHIEENGVAYNALSRLEDFLDTLEVKEVDLEKEIEQNKKGE